MSFGKLIVDGNIILKWISLIECEDVDYIGMARDSSVNLATSWCAWVRFLGKGKRLLTSPQL
jgi:hypothetical protein